MYTDSPDLSTLALVFGAEAETFSDVLLALQVDAWMSGAEVAVLGVRDDWLEGEKIGKALVVHPEGGIGVRDFRPPLKPDVAWVLHLPVVGERDLHRSLSSALLGSFQVNPYPASERADDKAWTHKLWDGLPTPAWTLIPKGLPAPEVRLRVEDFFRERSRVVVLPNRGTEGRDVELFRAGDEGLWEHIDRILRYDDVLLREERGLLRFRGPEGGFRRFALRVHVAWDGRDFRAESGFAQVASSQDAFPASRSRGGEIRPIADVLRNLYFREGDRWNRCVPTEDDIGRIREISVRAAEALNRGLEEGEKLCFLGLDLVCDLAPDRGLMPVLLEANPRPAGLQHARPLELREGDLSVTSALFHYLREVSYGLHVSGAEVALSPRQSGRPPEETNRGTLRR